MAFFGGESASHAMWKTPVNSRVPVNTNAVPIQWYRVKGFLKYKMEKTRLKNFRRVTTSVTISDGHSVVRMKTPRMHTYVRGGVKEHDSKHG